MSGLPEWLWPVEDEEAVLAAERLIEETHQTLRRMEANMQVQRISGQQLPDKSEKLKSDLNIKINTLERGLKSLSGPRRVVTSNSQPTKFNKPKSTVATQEVFRQSDDQPRIPFKSDANWDTQQRPLLLTKNSKPKRNMNTAEKEVLTARAKVQDALAVALNVSASLGQHVCTPTLQSKPQSPRDHQQVTNIGIFKVKSQADEKIQVPKMRLEQALLPSISIKRGLEMQSIPSIQVLPGEKIAPSNVSVFSVKHADEEKLVSTNVNCKERLTPIQDQHITNICPSNAVEAEVAIAQLSKQLSEVEELREINQAQVNHVLRFLLSRVCTSTRSPERSEDPRKSPTHHEPPTTLSKETKESSPTSVSSSSSETSQCPIAYDSLSRFLETYKKAAEHNMLARKRAVMRKQKATIKLKKEIEQVQNSTENHLLIGPLRRTVTLTEAEPKLSETNSQSPAQSQSSSSHSHQLADIVKNKDNGENIIKESNGNEINSFLSEKEDLNLSSYQESNKTSSHNSSVLLPLKQFREISGDEYEDDWEDEENHQQEKEEQLLDPSEQPIIEVEGYFHSSPTFLSQKSQLDPSISPVEPLGTSFDFISANQSIPNESKLHPNDKSPRTHEQSSSLKGATHLSPDDHKELVEKKSREHGKVTEVRDTSERQSIEKPVDDFVQAHQDQTPKDASLVYDNTDSEKPTMQPVREVKTKQNQSVHRKSQAKHLSSSCSSSDNEVNCDLRPPLHNSKWWDLKLREDIQLQSAILLNWQLEDRCKNKSTEGDQIKDNLALQTQQREIISDVERRWQRTLDQLDQRLKTIEDNDRIHRLVNEIRMRSREEETKPPISESSNVIHMESKIPMRDQIVQTSPEKYDFSLMNKELQQLSSKGKQHKYPLFHDFKSIIGTEKHHQCSGQLNEDLTSELLAYSRMGILARPGPEQSHSRSPSSSTVSSHLLSSGVVSSDGEMKDSACGSCSCSEGEFCMCGGRRHCSERAPPDGSFSDGENFLKDMSQGEIPPSQIKGLLKDTSHGEIGVVSGDPDLVEEESLESDDVEWDHR